MTDTENEITADLIAELLREQHPDLAGLPVTFGARGWDNQLWRLGDGLAVRLPWATQQAGELLLKEHIYGPLADTGEGFAQLLREATDRGLISDPSNCQDLWIGYLLLASVVGVVELWPL